MNKDNLHELINCYEKNLDTLYNDDHDEIFKWKAMKVWRDEWNKPDDAFSSFSERFISATREFSIMTDNSQMHPSSGVVKLCELEPETVEHLFREVLFKDPQGSVDQVQNNMDAFLEGYEKLLLKYYPKSWSFKQDRHSASVFLAMNDPNFNYVYKCNEALTMAKYIDFGPEIGSGIRFNLPNYYKLCEEIVSALKEHPNLLEKHFDRLTDEYYKDESLHLLAFDLMYCCRTYKFYYGLTVPQSSVPKRKSGTYSLSAEDLAAQVAARQATIDDLERQILELETECDQYSEISLIGVEVTTKEHGVGKVISQEINKITVQYADVTKKYMLHRRFSSHPTFENDDMIIELFTEYADKQAKIDHLRKELDSLIV